MGLPSCAALALGTCLCNGIIFASVIILPEPAEALGPEPQIGADSPAAPNAAAVAVSRWGKEML